MPAKSSSAAAHAGAATDFRKDDLTPRGTSLLAGHDDEPLRVFVVRCEWAALWLDQDLGAEGDDLVVG